jgi:TolB-like protein
MKTTSGPGDKTPAPRQRRACSRGCPDTCRWIATINAAELSLDHSAIRQQMENILAHTLFARSERIRRFLRLVVERTLEGRAGELKEYVIGLEAFDRKHSFDPRLDPIVRVEARRLRSKLMAYYEGDGRDSRIVIELVAGGYAPRIRLSCPAAVAAQNPPLTPPGIMTTTVRPFVNLGLNPENQYFSDGLTEELIHALTKVPAMRLVAWNSAAQMRDHQQDVITIGRQLQVATLLTGTVRTGGSSLRVCSHLIDTCTGVYLRSEIFDGKLQDIFAIQEEIACATVRTLRVQLSRGHESEIIGRSGPTSSSYSTGFYRSVRRCILQPVLAERT